jgi:hypothetical protein
MGFRALVEDRRDPFLAEVAVVVVSTEDLARVV